ncbi:MAG: ABC transporter substrate-binding protein, partial [Pseudomonadota bacterium]
MTRFTFKTTAIATLMLGAATPALAQDICGGAGSNGQWIGGDEASSDITTADVYREQMALVLGGNEYVSLFTLSAPTDVR